MEPSFGGVDADVKMRRCGAQNLVNLPSRIFIRQAFTCYQMYEMVARLPLDRMIAGRLVLIIAGPCVTFFDESVADRSAARLFHHMVYQLRRLSEAHLPILIVQANEGRLTPRLRFVAELRRLSPG